MPSYLPFLEALGAYIRVASQETLQAEAALLAPMLATNLLEPAERLGDVPVGRALPAEQARLRLFALRANAHRNRRHSHLRPADTKALP